MKTYTKTQKGIVTALSPISHGRIRAEKETDENNENNVLRFRTIPFLYKDENDNIVEKNLFCVSGNGMRGIGRRLMFHHAFQDVLDINFDELLSDFSPLERRYVVNLFENGGSSPKGSKATGGVPAATYDEVLRDLPMLDLLGGVYITHHFNGAAIIGNLILRTKETQQLLAKDHAVFSDDATDLPSIDTIKVDTERHTKTQNNRDASLFQDATASDEDKANLKNASIYGVEVLPIGTTFYWDCALRHTPHEGTLLAFDAFLSLIAQHGFIGGMNSKGYGYVKIQLKDLDTKTAIQKFDQWLLEHKDDVRKGIRLIAEEFKYELNKKSAKKGKGAKDEQK